ncbi:PREDICTED: uncharacterized protein LOC106812871 isoform X2 [Priapulus caudatus]|uniref:Uncharacterized protein LOC106812871 isoform X2 n=1 Tax=Priapulus caudatus TaxID=37621 RepID=A0ABM1EJI2_PRICU|nr:PREDICTED: uncharacterized protein LOC106812871 isoform X2 [Priapulus caudatus]
MNVSSRNKLVWNAIPTIFDVPNPPQRITAKRKRPAARCSSPSKKPKIDKDVVPTPSIESLPNVSESPSYQEKMKNLKRRNKALLTQIHRLKLKVQSIRTLNQKAAPLTKNRLQQLESLLKEYLSDIQLHFVMSQIRASNRTVRGRRWTTHDKAFALSLLHSSPKTYRILRKAFALPSVQTLMKVMNNLELYPGFNTNILEALRLKVQNLPPVAKLVCIAMDEMCIKTALSYDRKRDIVEGLVEQKLANHAIAFIVRGIIYRWKQPFGFFFSAGTMSGEEMRCRLFEALELLGNIGLTVTAVISDQGSNNINLFQTKLHVTVDKPFFLHEGRKIFVIYDPPHLIKNIRNNLKKHGFTVDEYSIEWQHIRDFYYKDASKPTRLAPKLTEKHLNLPPFSSLRVKLACQVVSHSVATGMKVMSQWGIINKEAIHTAEFLECFDQLFNAFNSSTTISSSVMKHAFTATSGHKEFLLKKLKWLQGIKSKGS